MSKPKPVYLGAFDPIQAADKVDRYIEIRAPELAADETIESAVFTVTDAAGATVAGVISSPTYDGRRVSFRITAPEAGTYTMTVELTISDGQHITKTARLTVV